VVNSRSGDQLLTGGPAMRRTAVALHTYNATIAPPDLVMVFCIHAIKMIQFCKRLATWSSRAGTFPAETLEGLSKLAMENDDCTPWLQLIIDGNSRPVRSRGRTAASAATPMGGSTPPPPPLVSSNSALAATMMATMKHITTRLGAMETALSTGTKTGVTHVTPPPEGIIPTGGHQEEADDGPFQEAPGLPTTASWTGQHQEHTGYHYHPQLSRGGQ
jgi:hypothetical protein